MIRQREDSFLTPQCFRPSPDVSPAPRAMQVLVFYGELQSDAKANQIPNWKVREYFRRIVRSSLNGRTGSKEFRSVTRPSFQTM